MARKKVSEVKAEKVVEGSRKKRKMNPTVLDNVRDIQKYIEDSKQKELMMAITFGIVMGLVLTGLGILLKG